MTLSSPSRWNPEQLCKRIEVLHPARSVDTIRRGIILLGLAYTISKTVNENCYKQAISFRMWPVLFIWMASYTCVIGYMAMIP